MRETLRRTGDAIGLVAARRDTRTLAVGVALVYLVGYSLAVDDLALTGHGGVSLAVVNAPLDRTLQSIGYVSFEPIASLEVGPLVYLFSPIDAALAVVLSILVGVNLALTYLGVVQPRACGLESSLGVLAAVPALLSGAACCGPLLLLVVGVQATGVLVTGVQLLLPLAVGLLLASLVLLGRQVDPTLA